MKSFDPFSNVHDRIISKRGKRASSVTVHAQFKYLYGRSRPMEVLRILYVRP